MTNCLHEHLHWIWETLSETNASGPTGRMYLKLTGSCDDCKERFLFCGAKSTMVLDMLFPEQEFPEGSIPFDGPTLSDDGYEIRIPLGTAATVESCPCCDDTYGYKHGEAHEAEGKGRLN